MATQNIVYKTERLSSGASNNNPVKEIEKNEACQSDQNQISLEKPVSNNKTDLVRNIEQNLSIDSSNFFSQDKTKSLSAEFNALETEDLSVIVTSTSVQNANIAESGIESVEKLSKQSKEVPIDNAAIMSENDRISTAATTGIESHLSQATPKSTEVTKDIGKKLSEQYTKATSKEVAKMIENTALTTEQVGDIAIDPDSVSDGDVPVAHTQLGEDNEKQNVSRKRTDILTDRNTLQGLSIVSQRQLNVQSVEFLGLFPRSTEMVNTTDSSATRSTKNAEHFKKSERSEIIDSVDRHLLAARSIDNVRVIEELSKKQIKEKGQNNTNQMVAAGGVGHQVLTPRSVDNIESDIVAPRDKRSPLPLRELSKQVTLVAKETNDSVLAARSTDKILVTRSNQSPVSESMKKQTFPDQSNREQTTATETGTGTGDQILSPRSVHNIRSDITKQSNRSPSSDQLKKTDFRQTVAAGGTENQILGARSLDNVTSQRQKAMVEEKFSDTTKANLLFARSDEMVKGNNSIRKRKPDEMEDVNAVNVISNKPSIVSDELLIEERNLSSEQHTDKNDELSDEKEEKDRHKVKLVNSTCRRQLLNDEALIERLSEKVLEKLFTDSARHSCGPNCKCFCGGLNPYFDANKDNSRNSQ